MISFRRIEYPESWPQGDRDALDSLFVDAKRDRLWFWHSSVVGTFWFSPEELQDEQAAGRFVWSAENWRLRDPLERVFEFEQAAATLAESRNDFIRRMMKR